MHLRKQDLFLLGLEDRYFARKSSRYSTRHTSYRTWNSVFKLGLDPYLQKDINYLERIQQRATKMVQGLIKTTFLMREDWKLSGCIHSRDEDFEPRSSRWPDRGFHDIDWQGKGRQVPVLHTFIIQSSERTQFELLYKPQTTRQVRQNFFCQRVIDAWNKLPCHVVTSTSVNNFKNNLDDHWNDLGTKSWCFSSLSTYN